MSYIHLHVQSEIFHDCFKRLLRTRNSHRIYIHSIIDELELMYTYTYNLNRSKHNKWSRLIESLKITATTIAYNTNKHREWESNRLGLFLPLAALIKLADWPRNIEMHQTCVLFLASSYGKQTWWSKIYDQVSCHVSQLKSHWLLQLKPSPLNKKIFISSLSILYHHNLQLIKAFLTCFYSS